MKRGILAGLFGLGLGMAIIAGPVVRAAETSAPAKPDAPAKPETPGRPGAAGMDPVARLQELLGELQLNDDQKAKAQDIVAQLKDEVEKSRAAAKEGGDRREAMRKGMEAMRDAIDRLRGILNDEQKTALMEKLQAARERMGAAGGAEGGRVSMAERLKQATADMALNDEVRRKIEALGNELDKKVEEIRAAAREQGGAAGAREKLAALREEVLKGMKAILSDEDYKKFEAKMQQQQPRPGGAGGGEAGGRGMAMFDRLQESMKELGLNEEQKAKMQAAFADARKRMEELRASFKDQAPGEGAREKFRQIGEDLRAEFGKILTPEQQEKLRSLMPARGEGGAGGGERRPGAERRPAAEK